MGWYARYVLPKLLDVSCGSRAFERERTALLPALKGVVLEVGVGSGHNLPLYPRHGIVRVIGIDPDAAMLALAKPRAEASPHPVELLSGVAEKLPIPDQSVDSLLVTFSLCTIPDPDAAIREFRRVLSPEGTLHFAEHGRSPEEGVARWQDRLNGLWMRLAGGCHLNRDIPNMLRKGGFELHGLHQGYLKKTPRFVGYISRGSAVFPSPSLPTS